MTWTLPCHHFSQFLDTAMDTHGNDILGYPKFHCNLARRELVEITHRDGGPISLVQFTEQGTRFAGSRYIGRVLDGIVFRLKSILHHGLERNGAFAARTIDDKVVGDSVEEGAHMLNVFALGDVHPCLREGFLHNVTCDVPVSHSKQAMPKKRISMRLIRC